MLKNYLKIAWRNLVKGKRYAIINITGLAVGIACCLLIGLYVYEELRYDRFHENSDQIYRVINTLSSENETLRETSTPKPLAPFLKAQFPEVQHAVRMQKENGVVRIDNRLFNQQFFVAEEGFLEMFSFSVLQGNVATAMSQRDEILLTESSAQRFFGTTDVIGRAVELRISGEYYPAIIGGILEDPPQHSSIAFEVVVPLEYWKKVDPEGYARGNNWGTLRPKTYVQLQAGNKAQEVAQKIENTMKAELPESATNRRGIVLQPLTDVHFDTSVSGGLEPAANVSFVYISVALAILILVIACINFMSISIGLSARRAREVGMRKAVGAFRSQVMAQFWSETMLVVLFSLLLGLMLTELLVPYFSVMIGKTLTFNWFSNPALLAMVVGTVLVTGFLAGSYPAVYLSKFEPSQVFRNKITVEGKHLLTRSLTGIQFALATVLIIGTFFMNQQMDLLQNKSLGFSEEFVIEVETPYREGKAIINDLRALLNSEPSVSTISGVWETIATEGVNFNQRDIESADKTIKGFTFGADSELKKTLNLEITQGRNIRRDATNEVLVNQELVNAFGWKNPIGKKVSSIFTFENAEIVGAVKDFHFQSLHQPLQPLVIYPASYYAAAYIRVGTPVSSSLEKVEAAWQEPAPGLPFNYTFLDETIEQQYHADTRWAQIVQFASGVAILIACMGLFGLAMLASLRRLKEISIRKVLGASVTGLVALLSKDFLKPVLIALFIAVPAAYLLMQYWLQNFAYKIELGLWTFIVAVGLTLVIALATVSWQSIRAALANPVDSLRSE